MATNVFYLVQHERNGYKMNKENKYYVMQQNSLSFEDLDDQQKQKVNAVKKMVNREHLSGIIIGFLMGFLSLAMNIYTNSIGQSDSESIILLSVISFVFLSAGVLSFFSKLPKSNDYFCAKYGTVKRKRIGMSHRSSGGSNRKYYLDIVLRDTEICFDRVLCCKKDYDCAAEGQIALVFVFSNQKRNRLYGILV